MRPARFGPIMRPKRVGDFDMAVGKTISKPIDKRDLLTNHPLFRDLPARAIEQIASYMTRRKVPRGKRIFAKGDPGTGLMGVLSGAIRISIDSSAGKEVVLNVIRAGEIFGEIALLDGHPRTADAVAMTDCELIVIDRREFIAFLRGEPNVALKIIEILCARLRWTSSQVEDMTFLGLADRLAKAILHLGGENDSGAKITITQREIGQIIGMSRESTNKQLRAWARRKWVSLGRGSVTILNRAALAKIAEEGIESNFV
jgi:CRP/FNR family transcriptional regulator, cyclic AMP receptor protein